MNRKHQAFALVTAATLGMGIAQAEDTKSSKPTTAKPTASPAAKAPSAKPADPKAATKPAVKPATKPAAAKPGAKPGARPGTKPGGKPGAKPAAKTALPPGARMAKPGISDTVKTVGADGKPIWLDLPRGLSAARQGKKFMMVDLSTEWCGWCKRLDHDVFQNPTVETFLAKNIVCVRLDAEDGATGQALAKKYEVHGYPTILFFTPTGGYHGRVEGYRPVADFSKILNLVAQGQPLPEL